MRITQKRSINCTVVELKPEIKTIGDMSVKRINCTVVELKHFIHRTKRWNTSVLIVPLWN